MPWTGTELAERHNHALEGRPAAATAAATQANAILKKTGNEGLALAVANKHAKRHRAPRSPLARVK